MINYLIISVEKAMCCGDATVWESVITLKRLVSLTNGVHKIL